VQVAEGALRSIFQPVMGPAVVQLPTLSQKLCVPVEAFAFSAPGATVVDSSVAASPAIPDPPSVAPHDDDWLKLCHAASAVAGVQVTEGALRSIFQPVTGPA
jgi:hypothetical protein